MATYAAKGGEKRKVFPNGRDKSSGPAKKLRFESKHKKPGNHGHRGGAEDDGFTGFSDRVDAGGDSSGSPNREDAEENVETFSGRADAAFSEEGNDRGRGAHKAQANIRSGGPGFEKGKWQMFGTGQQQLQRLL